VVISRVEPDGVIITHLTGVAKIPFTELSKELQDKYHYDPAAAERFIASQRSPSPPPTILVSPAPNALSAPRTIETEKLSETKTDNTPTATVTRSNQLDDPGFEDLRRHDWYEDLKAQEKLRNHATFVLALIESSEKDDNKGFEKCTPTFFKMLAEERKAHRDNYKALATLADKIMQAKEYEDYRKLKAAENQVLSEIETQKIVDHNHVTELRMHVSERDAELLEITQRYE
jgi:hypothetical protein